MDFLSIMKSIGDFFLANPVITVIVALVLIYLLYRKPKLVFLIFVILVVLAGVLYVILDVSSTGVSQKERLIDREMP